MNQLAFIIGTSGLIGKQLMHQLLQDERYAYVISIGRRKLALKHHKLIQVSGDFSNAALWNLEHMLREEDLGGQLFPLWEKISQKSISMHAFCSLGTTIKQAGSQQKFYEIDHDYVVKSAAWLHQQGVSRYMYVSAIGADPMSKVFYNKVKGEVEEDLKVIPFDYLGLMQPSLLLGNRSEFRLGEEFAKIITKPMVWFNIYKKYRPIYDHQVAKAMLDHANQAKSVKVQVIANAEMVMY
ncbi:Rossmann-fold NAD(P)-binding domain-containing protein [Mongoliitalea daihaiensis]|uniref:oxidoreductase n=1 Tax=Mongoliitalea daihaiensis TaxID=2782006 RepID=UPI001F20E9A0|nr:oxidoreductase [Mongoliitalea daihaiensis]UJP63831.1 oxidoreductase [Mongoliitalea daihaiensis]